MKTDTKKPNKAQGKPTTDNSDNSPVSHEAIAVAAYYRAEHRGFVPGGELDDWLQAECELGEASQQSKHV